MADIHRLDTPWFGPLEVSNVIEGAGKSDYEHVLIIGVKDGAVTIASNFAHKADIAWLLDKVRHDLLAGRWG